MASDPARLYSFTEAAGVLAVSRPTVYRLVRAGVLPAVRVPGIAGMRIRDVDLSDYVRSARRVTPVDAADDGRPRRSRSRKAVA
jgi:excisionase family DNA binding protein